MLIRQAFTDSTTGRRVIKDVNITLEEVRPPGSREPSTRPCLVARCDDIVAFVDPSPYVAALLDAKRTYVPDGSPRSRAARDFAPGGPLAVTDVDALDVKPGDPLAVVAGGEATYVLVTAVDGDLLTVAGGRSAPAGSAVHNLRGRWRDVEVSGGLGVCAALARPEPVAFIATSQGDHVEVAVTVPWEATSIRCYDVYLRSDRFSAVEPHWLPDLADVDIGEVEVTVSTCDGGQPLAAGRTYYLTVVTKDAPGLTNVNESTARFVEAVRT